jgi:hypothetical protein
MRLASGDLLGRFCFTVLRWLASVFEDSGFVGVSSMFCENLRVTCVIVSSSCPPSAVGDVRPGLVTGDELGRLSPPPFC